jgi:hypothetical protein
MRALPGRTQLDIQAFLSVSHPDTRGQYRAASAVSLTELFRSHGCNILAIHGARASAGVIKGHALESISNMMRKVSQGSRDSYGAALSALVGMQDTRATGWNSERVSQIETKGSSSISDHWLQHHQRQAVHDSGKPVGIRRDRWLLRGLSEKSGIDFALLGKRW